MMPPLMLFGAGANARLAVKLMIAAGMLAGVPFTLFVLPTCYPLLGRRRTAAADDAVLPAVGEASGKL